jgi:5S rRNA maturation endonuclease (ribonuclease M5)
MDSKTYLTEHGLSEDFVTKQLGWRFHPDKIEIPIYNLDGKKVYSRYRMFAGENKFLTEKGAKLTTLYRASKSIKFPDIVFCEGEPDCAKLWQEGIPAVTFPSGVKSLTAEGEGISERVNKIIEPLRSKNVYINLDNDEAGQSTVMALAKRLRSIGCKVFISSLPKTVKDICEYFVSGATKQDYQQLLTNSPTYESLILDKFKTEYPILDNDTFTNKEYPPTKWLIDKLIRIGGISFLVGESGTGKTIASLSIAKAISEGTPWLDKFDTNQTKILIIDKENTPSDIQKLFKSMGISNKNVFNFFTDNDYSLFNEKGETTKIGEYLSLFIKVNNIGLVILDSAIDFLIGDESSSGDVATNINKWREIFFPASILTIHHFKKSDPRSKIKAADMMRGSSVWLSSAQSVLAFSSSIEHPERILVEHAKVRGGAKVKPFQIEMIIRPDPYCLTETVVNGFKFNHEVNEVKLKIDEAKEAITTFLNNNPTKDYSPIELEQELRSTNITRRNIDAAIPQLVQEGDIFQFAGEGKRGSPYTYKICVTGMLEKLEKNVDNY